MTECYKTSEIFLNTVDKINEQSLIIPGGPPKNGTVDTVDFSGLCSDQQLSFFTLLDRASFPHYNNTKIIKFGWELFILWVISYGPSFYLPDFQSSEARLKGKSSPELP